MIECARDLFIHPNTLRQRLGRIEELTGLNLDEDDLLSLELAIKLARLPRAPGDAAAKHRAAGDAASTRRGPGMTGIFALRRTRWGSWDQIMLPTNRLRSGSAAITIASQPASWPPSRIRLVDLRVPSTCPSASMPLRSSALDRLATIVALLRPLGLGRQQARAGHPERDAVDAGDREHVDAGVRGRASSTHASRSPRSGSAALGGEQDPFERILGTGARRLRLASAGPPRSRAPTRPRSAAGVPPRRSSPAARRRSVLDPLSPRVERQVGQQHRPADEVVRQRLAPGGVSTCSSRTSGRHRSR